MVQTLGNEFQSEIKTKQDALDVTQAHLRAATRELSEQRKQIQQWTQRCGEMDQVQQRVRNLEKALDDEDAFDWTGRTVLDGADPGPAFCVRGLASTMTGAGAMDLSFNLDAEPPVPMQDSVASLIKLRRMKMWHERMERMMDARLRSLQGASAEKEFQCKKIVALCTGVPIDKVEEVRLSSALLEQTVLMALFVDAGQPAHCSRERGADRGYRPCIWFYAKGMATTCVRSLPVLTNRCRPGQEWCDMTGSACRDV